jgi:hypothetical protein
MTMEKLREGFRRTLALMFVNSEGINHVSQETREGIMQDAGLIEKPASPAAPKTDQPRI